MRVDVEPRQLSVVPGTPTRVMVTVANTGTLISGHHIRVLGLDPQWVSVDQERLSLFPDSTGVAAVTLNLPAGLPAGLRTLTIEVTELTPPRDVVTIAIELAIPAEPGLKLVLDPVSVTAGKAPAVALVLENVGNAALDVHLDGADDEGAITFSFDPAQPQLEQGDQKIGRVRLRAHRPWLGSPKVRPFTVRAGPSKAPVIAYGAWVQKPRLTRGMLALIGLVLAATVFAVVLATSLSQVVNNSNADRDLALQVAEASQNPTGAGAAGRLGAVTGTVTLLTSGSPVPGVTVDVFAAANPTTPVVSTATGSAGTYSFSGLTPGKYKLEFNGAGFNQLWYPDSLSAANATPVTLSAGATNKNINVRLGGLPASISGQVVGAPTAGAVLTLEVPPKTSKGGAGGSTAASAAGATPTGTVVTTQTIGSSGNFALGNIPSPAVYELVVTKADYAPAVQEVDLSGGQQRKGITITLHQGNGSIAGTVSSLTGPLAGATISASDGSTTVSTISVSTAGAVGTFVLNNLPTPDAYTLVVSASGYATQTLSQSLASGQQLTGVSVSLTPGVGSISGTVTAAPPPGESGGPSGAVPAGGVTVTATNGSMTVTTTTLSIGAVGTYTLTNLPVPGTYTVTFSRSDLASQTQAVSLSATGPTNPTGIDAALVGKTATLYGTVTQTGGGGVGQVTVLLSSGSISYQVTSASVPTAGAYEIDGITPGTYTVSFTRVGGSPTSAIVTLTAGQRLPFSKALDPAASIFGQVVNAAQPSEPVPGVQVNLYLATQFPLVVTTTVITDAQGGFSFTNVDAPQNFIVAFAYPQGASNQETVAVITSLGVATPVCGSQTTGNTTSTTTVGATPTTSTTTVPSTSTSTSTTTLGSTTTTSTTVAPTTTTTATSPTTTATTPPDTPPNSPPPDTGGAALAMVGLRTAAGSTTPTGTDPPATAPSSTAPSSTAPSSTSTSAVSSAAASADAASGTPTTTASAGSCDPATDPVEVTTS